ncbi:hypothetical protein RS130_13525 [Paraglaciecola aquimarina]|uniref:Lipoprotein n=1 Tax=Paraglaciecola aquimarina TaxID=1235557 RepID=A0ABU3SXT7_9ALTE|nr:hypothetical protein [Paraglaciecola aquimarina]MDU0354804.1 hypothetical protein [Paraglaciecola aquimarina]
MKNIIIVMAVLVLLTACVDNTAAERQTNQLTTEDTATTTEYKEGDNIPAIAYIEHNEVYNAESVIPPQCYTKTQGDKNPCYACHQTYKSQAHRPNTMNDGDLQGEYQFSDLGTKNHWKNLFVDRTELIKNISDDDIKKWIAEDNYAEFVDKFSQDPNWQGEVTPIENLAEPTKAFDSKGLAKDGSNWVAFNYKPFPSTFWPTNGSTGDAMIRLPKAFREKNGLFSVDVYFANLALVEMVMKETQLISMVPVSEIAIGEDIDGDGELLADTRHIKIRSHYLGDASQIALSELLYPENTEFLHTVRYIGVNEDNSIYNAQRMKEVRYMKKHSFKSKAELASEYYLESKEKHFENLPQVHLRGDKGVNSNMGWTLNGYIEDENGQLRHQNSQELAFCAGCHKTIGANLDQTFSFPRKVEGARGWGYINLANQEDAPNLGEENGEYLTYFQRVGGGDEFRQNKEMLSRWFKQDGSVDTNKVTKAQSVYELITPSAERALQLNKAYLTIVKEQSYIFGRDANLTAATNVLKQVDESQAPLSAEHRYQWDLRLNWQKISTQSKQATLD